MPCWKCAVVSAETLACACIFFFSSYFAVSWRFRAATYGQWVCSHQPLKAYMWSQVFFSVVNRKQRDFKRKLWKIQKNQGQSSNIARQIAKWTNSKMRLNLRLAFTHSWRRVWGWRVTCSWSNFYWTQWLFHYNKCNIPAIVGKAWS